MLPLLLSLACAVTAATAATASLLPLLPLLRYCCCCYPHCLRDCLPLLNPLHALPTAHSSQARKEVSGRYPGRLLTMAEVPEHVHTVESLFDETIAKEKELLDYGAGKRERKKVAYTDGLTDRQFLRLVCYLLPLPAPHPVLTNMLLSPGGEQCGRG